MSNELTDAIVGIDEAPPTSPGPGGRGKRPARSDLSKQQGLEEDALHPRLLQNVCEGPEPGLA
jgi:hypothetical protein